MTPPTRLARVMLCGFFALLFLIINVSEPAFAQIYVKADAVGLDDGTSWTNAYTDLQGAIAAALNGDEIWVAAGTYKPTSGTDRSFSFWLKTGVGIYGGFAGDLQSPRPRYDRRWPLCQGFRNSAGAVHLFQRRAAFLASAADGEGRQGRRDFLPAGAYLRPLQGLHVWEKLNVLLPAWDYFARRRLPHARNY